jgi:nucleoprotein TPR
MEANELSAQLAQALSDRDSQAKAAEEFGQKLKKSTAESNLLQQQLDDLGRQIQTLLREIARHEDPTIPQDADLMNLPVQEADNVNDIITNNLVLFRNIEGLQAQNQKLLGIVRELGDKMESEEREYKEAMQQEQAEAIREAHEAMQDLAGQLEQQKKHSEGVIQAYVKERDALKSMLARAQAAASRAGLAIDIGQQQAGGASSAPLPDTEVAKELVEVQQQFEAYRTEMGVDSTRLREELSSAQREIHDLSAGLAKSNAKVEYLTGEFILLYRVATH